MIDKIKKVIFYNFWHNGDLFINRNYVKDIMSQIPNAEFFYAHKTHTNNTLDLCQSMALNTIHSMANTRVKFFYDEENLTLYINTWVGCYQGEYIPVDGHTNLFLLYKIWSSFYNIFGFKINPDWKFYLPDVDYTKFNLDKANNYLNSINNKEIVLICNNQQQSRQSSLGDMKNIILELSKKYPNKEFLVTNKLNAVGTNISYSDDIFESQTGNLNYISYLSTKAKYIIGKNSGPFTFSHVKENINNSKKFIISFSHKKHECLLGENTFLCKSFWSTKINDFEVIESLVSILDNHIDNVDETGIQSL